MNKIFKVIWSKSKQCYIVVSEMAKNHSGKKKIVVASILATMAVGGTAVINDVNASAIQRGAGADASEGAIAIGDNAKSLSDGSIAMGKKAAAQGTEFRPAGSNDKPTTDPSIAIGDNAYARGNASVAIGYYSQINQNSYAVAVGRESSVQGDYGVSVGYNTRSAQDGTAVGEQARSKKQGATALGVSSRGYSQGGVAIGWQSLAGANVYTAGVPGSDINKDNETDITNYGKWGDVAIGLRAMATGGNATAVGRSANATEANAIAIGGGDGKASNDNVEHTIASGEKAIAIGYKALASDKNATSIGTDAQARQSRATAIGYEVRAEGKNAVAIGSSGESSAKVVAKGEDAIAIGTRAQGNNIAATAIGKEAVASDTNSIAFGTSAKGVGASSTAIGNSAEAKKSDAIALGTDTEASEERAVAIGKGATAEKVDAVALGTSATSGGANGVAIGNDAQAQAADTIAVGSTSRASSANDSAFGNAAKATGGGATAIGYTVTTSGNQAFGAGSNSEVSGAGAVGIGYKVKASGNRAISIGNDNGDANPTVASGEKAIAIGSGVKATDSVSIAMGRNAQSLREYTTAIGTNVIASKEASGSTLIGYNSTTKGNQSVNIGSTNTTEETAQYSTAIGYKTNVSGMNAIAIGSGDGEPNSGNVTASADNAIAIGTKTKASAASATAIGKEAQATKTNAFAAGTSASATGETSTAVGNSASAAGARAVAVGTNTSATQEEGVAVGLRAKAKGIRSVSVGIDTESTTSDGISVGYLSKSQGLGAIAIGRNAVVSGDKSVAVGYDLTVTDTGSTNIGYTSSVAGNQAVSVGARNTVEAGASAGAALGYFVNLSGKNAIGIGAGVNDTNRVTASGDNSAAIGTLAKATAASAMALGSNANAALAHSVALGEGSTTTEADGVGKTAYLSGEASNNTGNGVISVGNKRNASDSGTITRRIVSVAGGTDDYDAVNVNQLKALEKNEWLLRTQNVGDANPTDVAPQTVNNQTKKRVTLKAGDNIAISNSNGVVTLNVTNVVKTVTSGNTDALTVNNNNGAVTITPNIASSVGAANEDNKLVTSGKVKTALDNKIDKTAEMHIKSGEYTVNTEGTASLIQQNGNNQDQTTRVTIKDIAKKSVVDTLQSDFNTFKATAITFTGDDNQGVARTLDTTLTVKGGANYTSTTTNTNIRVEKDGTNGANGLLVKLSDKLTGMKEIVGTGSQDLVIKNGNTTVTVKAPANGDKGTVDFGNAKVVAPNLDASISYKAGNGDTKKTVKLQDGFNFTAATDTTTTAEGPKSGLAIKAEDNGKVTFGLDKATREKVDNAADKNLSNLSDTGKDKVKELAKTAAQDAVKVAAGINTTVTTDTTTTAGVTTYKVNANDTTVAVTGNGLAITGGELGTDKVRKYSLDLSAATKGKLAAVGNLATNVIGGTTIAADGTVTGPTFSITKADGTAENAGTIKAAIEKLDAANKGQNTKISDTAEKVTNLATALGGGAKVENGTFTGPTYNITKANGSGTETASNVGEAITKLDNRITTANGTLVTKGLDFTGNDTTNTGKVHRDLGTTLTIKGAENFTRAATETNNIKVVKNGDALDVKLAENLAKMKEISGDGASDLVIKNGDTKVTVKAPTSGDKGTVDFGDAKVIAKNLDASIAYKAGNGDTKKTVKLQDGFNFTAATDTAADTNVPKSGLAITTGDNGVVTFGLDKATRSTIDNAADKNLSNLSDAGKDKVKELAKGAAQDAVKVANGINTTVTTDTTTTPGVTMYKVNANDTTVAVTGDGLSIKGGDLGTDKVRKYSLDLSNATKGKLKAVDGLSTVIGGTNITADGTVTGPTFSITNAAGTAENAGTIKEAIEKLEAANKGQNTKISDTAEKVTNLATALGGGAKVENGTFTGPTYNITKADGSGTETASNVGDAISKLDNRITTANGTLVTKGLDFTGNDTTAKVHRDLGTTLTIKGAENFTRAAAENNIKVVKNGDALDVKLAENLTKMKEISGDGASDLVIKNGNTTVTVKAPTSGDTGTVDFGKAKVVAPNLDASISYKAGNGDTKKTVKLQDGFNFTAATDATTTAEGPKSGLAITTGDNGVVTFGLDKATRSTIDNAADKDLSNLTDTGKTTVKELAKGAAQDAVKVADGINTTVEKDTATAGVTTYKVNANDTTVAVTGNGLAITGGDLGADKVRKYTLDLSAATKGKLAAVGNLATNVIGGTTVNADGTVVGPTFSITKADGTTEQAKTIKDAIDKLNATNAGQNTKINDTAEKVTTLDGKVSGIVEKGMVFAGDDAAADKVTRKLGETLNIHGQNNISVKKDGTSADTLNVKLASELKNITSISSGDGTTGSIVTLGADGVSIANTKDGATKTVTIGKDGINAGGMKITNVAEATENGDAANKKYVDDAISNLGNIVSGNATLNFAGNVTKDKQNQDTAKVGLSLATGTLHVNGANNEITTTAKGDTITVGLAETVKAQLAKVGDTSSNGRDGKDGTSGAQGLTGKDGLNDKTLTEKVNALRNGEAGSVVYTDENGTRLVKAKDGEYYKAADVDATGNVLNGATKATTVEARVVNPDGTTTGGTTKLSNIADGKVAAGSKDAVNGGQLHTAKSEIGAIIGGTTINENGKITGPTFSITNEAGTAENAGTIKEAVEKLDAANKGQNTKISENTEKLTKLGETVTTNYNDLSKKITDGATNITNTLTTKGLDFTGNDITDAGKLHRDLGTTLTIKGTENFTRAATENNIKVVKNGDALDVKLAENLANMKEISGNGKDNLVIKNGDATITLKPKKEAEGTNPATPATVDFGETKVVASNLDANISYKAGNEDTKKKVKLQDGFNFTAATDTTVTAEGPKAGLAITAEDNGKVTFGLDKATRSTIDNAADKDLSNLTDTGKNTVKELAKGAVKVAEGINTTVTTDTTTAGVTTYKVNANDTTVAVNADTLAISGGDLDATTKVRAYTLDLSNTVKAKLNAINNVGDTASNGRDGVNGASGAKGLTGKDGLNDKTLTDKVNALRNGEAGSVVYTNEAGDRVVKAKDGQYYKATDVDATGNVLNNAKPATTVEARVVNPDGTTTGGTTKLSNIADGKVAAGSKDAVNGGQLHTTKSEIGAIIGGTTINENGKITGPTFSITNAAGTKDDVTTIKDAIEKLDATNAAQNTKISETTEKLTNLGDTVTNNYNDLSKKITDGSTNITNTLTTKGLDFTGNDTTAKVHRDLGTTLTIKGADNFTRTATEANNIKVVKTDNDLDVKLAENLGNIKSISNTTGEGKPGSTITLGADGVSIANTAAGAGGAAGETKTVTIGKDGINAGGMKVTNVAKAEADGDAANKAYVDDAIKNLNTTVTNNANLRYAGDTNVGAAADADHLNLPLATGTLKVAGTADQIKTVANNGTITLSLAEKVTNKLDKLGDTAADGRDGKAANGQAGDAGNAGDKGATGKDGLNGTNLTDKVNALRNGEAGSVVYTDENGERLVKANNGNYYKTTDVDKTGNVVNNAQPATTVEARVVNPDGTTTGGTTKLSNIADGKVAANSKDAVNGGQLHTAKSEIGAIIGGTTINENGKITGPTFSITNADGNAENAGTIKEAIEKLDAANKGQNTKISETAGEVTTLEGKVDGIVDKGMTFAGDHATADKVTRKLGETLNIHGQNNITVKKDGTAEDTLNVKLASDLKNITSITNADADGKPGSKITLDANGVSIANTAVGQDGTAGETKTVTIGKDGINAGGMKVTNVAKAESDGDAANKAYVDNAISNLNTTVTNNANLRYAGDTNEGAVNGEDHLNLPLATGTLKVAGTADQIKTVANNGTITLSLDEKVTNKLNKLGDTASNGRDGANGLTGKDGLNDKTLTEKVNALRNGEAGTVVYTDDAGERLVKANDGKYYHKDDLKADGTPKTADENNGTAPKAVDNPQARVVNPNGETKAPTTLSNIADGKVAEGSKDAVNGGQLNTVKTDLANALGGGAKVENGVFTGPTYNITKDDGSNTKEEVKNVGDAISKLDGRINNANTTLANKGLDFTGNDTTAKVHRNLGETLTIKGADNFTRAVAETNNIKVVKTDNDLDVKLAENLGNIKEIAGNGKDDLVIKNGDATITLKPKKDAEGTNPATPATVDFGDTKVVASNLDASIKYRANDEAAANAKSVKLADGFNFVASNVTDTTTEGPKSGLAIKAEDNGKVTFGLDKATREKVDNTADKNLSNLSDAGKNKVKELAGEAAKAAVAVADGINTTVTTDTTTTGVTTYKVNANDTTVAVTGDGLTISGGTPDATTKVRAYTLDLSNTVKAKLNAINNVGDTASNGRDGVNGASGAQGLTGKDGLNDKTLTDKVNALRNGEAGSVVYTNEAGDRVVKAKDGKYYKADEVKADGTVKTAEENNGKAPEEVKTPQARLVNPNGETTAPTTLSNIADGKVAADSKEAVNGGQLNTVKSDLATALGGGAKVENGVFTGPTYNITKADGTGTEPVKNVGEAISKLDSRINNANTALGNKGLDFYGNKDAADTDKVHRNLGEALKVKGAENFTREANAKNNIDVVKNTAGDGFDVKLAENLGNMKEIAGNGKDDLVIKNGDATITLKPKKDAEGTNPATPATVDFGNTKVVAPNLEASITYRANSAEDADAKTVTLQKGLNFVSGDGTAATAEAAKAGITIAADKDGKVVFGLNEATRNAIDNAADKNLNNLSQAGKDKVADLAKTAAREAVKVTAGNNVTVTPETKDGVTTYTVNGRDTTVKAADNGSVSVTGGTLNAKGEREYTVDLTAEAKAELGKISDLNTRLGSAEGKITTLQGDMTKAKDDIANNAKHIEANKEAIATNKNAIAANTKDIETNTKDIAANSKDIVANRKDIDANKQGIAENKKQIGENAKAIGKNAEDIKKNAQDIKNNTETIKSNTNRIQTVENRVTTAEGKIATNEKAIKDNASAIQSNTKAIGDNTTAIAKNANDITKANKEIESLKGNSATKDLSNLTNAGKDTITNLINVTGEHGITVTPSTDTTTRVKTFTAKLNDTVTFGSGDKKITVDGTTGTVTSKAVAADTVKANTVHAKTVQLGDSTGTNTTVTADGIAVTTKNPDGTTSKVEIKNGTVSGLTNTKWDPAKVVTEADRSVVATQGQVKDVADTLARGRVFVGDTGKTVTVDLGDTLAIKGGSTKALTDNNIGVVSTEAKDGQPATMTVKLAKDVKMKDGTTSYDYYLPEMKTNPDGSKEIIKNADGSVKHQLGKDGNPIRLVTTTVNGEGITIEPVKGLDKPTVSLTADGLDNGGNQIHNVAAGTLNTDAATVGQVRAAAHALNNRVNEAGAHAAALAAMNPLNYDPLKKSQVMAGVGSYKGNNALALGVAHYANEDTLFNVGIAVGDGSNMVNAGVTYRFGGEDSAVPERYKGGPISSVYVMQDEVSALKSENAEMKAQMKMLMERIEMLAAKA